MEAKPIHTSNDITEDVLRQAEEIHDGWFDNDEPIDWENFWDRLEMWGYSISDLTSPAAQKIQRHIRKFRKQV